MTLAKKLHYLMLLGGVSQIELAFQTKIERSTLTKILNGSTLRPKIDTIVTLAKYFNVEITELINTMDNNESGEILIKDSCLSNVLNKLMLREGIKNAHQLAKITNIPTNVIIDILTKKTSNPKIKTLQTLADFFNIPIPQLCGIRSASPISIPSLKVPLLQFEQIQSWLAGEKFDNTLSYINTNSPSSNNPAYAIEIQDNRFFPDLFAGNFIILSTTTLPKNKDLLLIAVNNSISIYEQISTHNNQTIFREAGNKEKISIDNTEFETLGVIVQQVINY